MSNLSKSSLSLLFFLFSILISSYTHQSFGQDSAVVITDRGNYYELIMDYSIESNPYEMGRIVGQKVLEAVPNIEYLIDSYLAEMIGSDLAYAFILLRVYNFKSELPEAFKEEIEGMASQMSGGNNSTMGDGKLSADELYLAQLIPDILRTTQCSGISVFGERSATGHPITARVLDWYAGSENQLAQIQSVTTIRKGENSICNIGYLSIMGIISGFNNDGVFASILDSPSEEPYSSFEKNSYIVDLRYALESCSTINEVAEYMSDSLKQYSFNHLILLSDSTSAGVMENNFSGSGSDMHRALRRDTSILNEGISWEYDYAVAAVNAFMLSGNHDNFTDEAYNEERWNSYKSQFQLTGDTCTLEEIKQIVSFDHGDGPGRQSEGDIYNSGTQQIILFQPDSFQLEIAFRPRSGFLPGDPVFEKIPFSFETKVEIIDTTDTRIVSSSLPCFSLFNYPNPFMNSTTISFDLPSSSFVKLEILDVSGRKIESLISRQMSEGNHKVEWYAEPYCEGIYFYRLKAGQFVKTQMLIRSK